MEQSARQTIESFNSLVLCDLPLGEDLFATPLHYVLGDFDIANLPHYRTLNAVIESIDPHAELSIGIGFIALCDKIRNGIKTCADQGVSYSIMLPLWDEHATHNFMMKASRSEGHLNLLFFYYERSGTTSEMDAVVAGSYKDQLTGLFNRRTMKEHVSQNHKNGYLCLFDLNKFKEINDTFGHALGDEVLTLIGEYLISIATENEVFYRRSGDEFMFLSFLHDRSYADNLITKIENRMEELSTKDLSAYPGLKCSASFGILELVYDDGSNIDAETELKLTDLAMYQAKRAGKRSHYIDHDDALRILEQGNLDERLNALAASIKR